MSDLRKRRRAALARCLVRVDVACNNPNNGCFAHEAAGIHFPAGCLELEAWWRPRRFVELDNGDVRLSGKRWPVVGSKDWVGNWCWNGYWMRADVAAALLVWMKRRQLFDADTGWCELFDWYKDPAAAMHPAFLLKILVDAQAERGS